MSEQNTTIAPVAEIVPDINLNDHAISNEVWESFQAEIMSVTTQINSGVELEPDDVKRVQSLKREVDEYITSFSREMRATQASYKNAILARLNTIGYATVEAYIAKKRTEQTVEQNLRAAEKLQALTLIVNTIVAELPVLRDTVLAPELVPAFLSRFPKIKSSAKSNDITDWDVYGLVIKTNLELVEKFLNAEHFIDVRRLPIGSQVIQQILRYIRTGQDDLFRNMKELLVADQYILDDLNLRAMITNREHALTFIKEYSQNSVDSTTETLQNISKLVALALSLPQ